MRCSTLQIRTNCRMTSGCATSQLVGRGGTSISEQTQEAAVQTHFGAAGGSVGVVAGAHALNA